MILGIVTNKGKLRTPGSGFLNMVAMMSVIVGVAYLT